MVSNPFSLDFGKKPKLYISRNLEQRKIIETFNDSTPSSHIFVLTGIRGCGKTVMMTSVSQELKQEKDWVHVDLSVDGNMFEYLIVDLCKKLKINTNKLSVNLSVGGVSVETKESKYSDIQSDLDSILEVVKKKQKKVLITIDEIVNSKEVREFASYFQHCIREEYPVFLIMTGLFKNIRALQNYKSLTFLRRTPKIELGALNKNRIAEEYRKIFNTDQEESMKLAMLTNGYSYAFQMLGYLLCDSGKSNITDSILTEYRINLEEYSYEKIWEELSFDERQVCINIANLPVNCSVKNVRECLGMDSNNFSTKQNTLLKSGILSTKTAYGKLDFSLPFFREFILSMI